MNKLAVVKHALEVATAALEMKRRQIRPHLRQAVTRELNNRQAAATERDLERVLVVVIAKHVDQIISKVTSGSKKNLLNEKQATKDIINAMAPILAIRMAEAARNQMLSVGLDYRKGRKNIKATKTSTATEWLMEQDIDDLVENLPDLFPRGMPYQLLTELPRPMRERIVRELRQSFKQDYWKGIAETTSGDANRILEMGVQDGWSIQQMAKQLRESLGGDAYARTRANNIARTESGNSLNAARRGVMDQLQEDLGDRIPMRPMWLSVLGNTTRDTHAALDGVPADDNGFWNLGGYKIPWPAHYSLPAGERCNCRCSLFTAFGLQDDEAAQLLQDYENRQEAAVHRIQLKGVAYPITPNERNTVPRGGPELKSTEENDGDKKHSF